jgi:hypothetical protein
VPVLGLIQVSSQLVHGFEDGTHGIIDQQVRRYYYPQGRVQKALYQHHAGCRRCGSSRSCSCWGWWLRAVELVNNLLGVLEQLFHPPVYSCIDSQHLHIVLPFLLKLSSLLQLVFGCRVRGYQGFEFGYVISF